VVLLNVVFGIIIDTFAELRESSASREVSMKKFCFVCNISSETFDRAGQASSDRRDGWLNHYHTVADNFFQKWLQLCHSSNFPFIF
jgi:inositol 1,4,5-triphosphate receptor type 3